MATLLNETFDYTGASLLGGQGGWVLHPSFGSDMKIAAASGYARLNTTLAHCALYNSVSVADGDYTVYMDGSTGTVNLGKAAYVYLGTRYSTSADTGYLVEMYAHFGGSTLTLYRVVAGTPTAVGTPYNYGVGGGFGLNMDITATGTGSTVTVEVKLNGVSRISYSDTDASRIVTAGKPLVRGYSSDTVGDGLVCPSYYTLTVTGNAPGGGVAPPRRDRALLPFYSFPD